MDIFNVITLFGGLALFLYGMDVMGKGLEKMAGGKLEKILESLTSSTLKAVLLGTGVTAIIQSSSAVTVMVVGFVNSGIMKLGNVVGIIMGANIGTTITSWLLSLTGIQSGNFWIRLCKPSSFAPVLALIGIIMILGSKKEKYHDIGHILVGFAVLMTGMETMSASVSGLKDIPAFTNILIMFKTPVFGVLAGAGLTAVIQSSSASVGILQALCMTGKVTLASAIPIIMGQNIGTCVTAIISSLGSSRNAKRTASIHLLFNLIGSLLFLAVFYSIHMFVNFNFMELSATPVHIAEIHSAFNISATLLLLPFHKLFVKMAYLVLPESEDEKTYASEQILPVLDEHFLEMPSFALVQVKNAANLMLTKTKEALCLSNTLINHYDPVVKEKIKTMETLCDNYDEAISNYLLQISSKNLSLKDTKEVNNFLHAISDIESISDAAVDLSVITKKFEKVQFSLQAMEEISVLEEAILEMMDSFVSLMNNGEGEECYIYEQVIKETIQEIKARHVTRLMHHECSLDNGLVLMDIFNVYQ